MVGNYANKLVHLIIMLSLTRFRSLDNIFPDVSEVSSVPSPHANDRKAVCDGEGLTCFRRRRLALFLLPVQSEPVPANITIVNKIVTA